MKMDITKRRKMMALFLAGTLTVSAAVTGCGRKNVDYNVDNTQPKQTEADLGQTETSASGEDLDSGSLWSKYKIPFTCDTEIAVGDTGLSKIHVTDDDISVPDTSDLQIAQYKKKDPEIIPRMIMLVLWMGRNMNCITKPTAFIVPLICGKIL